jgi:hypothetical protein
MASGTLTASLVSGDQYLVTGISGTQNGFSMTLLDVGAYAGNDNDIYSSVPYLDGSGVSFSADGIDYNIFYNVVSDDGYFEANSVSNPLGAPTPVSPLTSFRSRPHPSRVPSPFCSSESVSYWHCENV